MGRFHNLVQKRRGTKGFFQSDAATKNMKGEVGRQEFRPVSPIFFVSRPDRKCKFFFTQTSCWKENKKGGPHNRSEKSFTAEEESQNFWREKRGGGEGTHTSTYLNSMNNLSERFRPYHCRHTLICRASSFPTFFWLRQLSQKLLFLSPGPFIWHIFPLG
jgi:hypothetical protein